MESPVCETSINAQQQQQQQTERAAAINIKQPKSNAQRSKECRVRKKNT
jgi:spore germination cell wall hydrolase CwlJ-like protein